jgi:hypothetical protein
MGVQPPGPQLVTNNPDAQRQAQLYMARLISGPGWSFSNPRVGFAEYWKFNDGTTVKRRIMQANGVTASRDKSDATFALSCPVFRLGAKTIEFTLTEPTPGNILALEKNPGNAIHLLKKWKQEYELRKPYTQHKIVVHVPDPLPDDHGNSNANHLLISAQSTSPPRTLTIDFIECSEFFFGGKPDYPGCQYRNPVLVHALSPSDLAAYQQPINSRTYVEAPMPSELAMQLFRQY